MLASDDLALVARDVAVPGLGIVLDAEAAAELVGLPTTDSPTISYVRYKPGRSCLTSLTAEHTDTSPYVLRAFARDAEGDAAWRRAVEDLARYGIHARIDAARRVLAFPFPFDRALPAMGRLLAPAQQPRTLAHLGLTSASAVVPMVYKPGRRFVARVDALPSGRRVVIKCHTIDDFVTLGPVPAWLGGDGASHGVRVAQEVGRYTRRAARAFAWLPGEELSVRLIRGVTTSHELRRVGRALALLHGGALGDGDPSGERSASDGGAHDSTSGAGRAAWRLRPADGDIATLRAVARDVGALLPPEAHRLHDLAERLAHEIRVDQPAPVPTHGDFYAKQVLIDGDVVGLIDFDDAALDDPHADLGLFLAHLERDVARGVLPEGTGRAATDALLSGYADHSRALSERRLALRLAEALVRLAPHPFRHRAPQWASLTRTLLDRAEGWLRRAEWPTPGRGAGCGGIVGVRVGTGTPAAAAAHNVSAGEALRPDASLRADPQLAFAAPLLDPVTAARALRARRLAAPLPLAAVQGVAVLRHKPGRRAVFRFDVTLGDGTSQAWLGKVRARGTDERTVVLSQALRAAGLRGDAPCPVGVPAPVGVVDGYHLSLFQFVDGETATVHLARPCDDPWGTGARLAQSMAALHRAPITARRRRTVEDELRALVTRLEDWRLNEGALAPLLDQLRGRCVAIARPLHGRRARVLLHRDLHPDQVLVDDRRSWLIDLDLAADGDPALDAGNMTAHLLELAVRHHEHHDTLRRAAWGFASAACQLRGLDADAVARFTVLSLARLADIARQMPARHRWAEPLLHRALAAAAHGGNLDAVCDTFLQDAVACA